MSDAASEKEAFRLLLLEHYRRLHKQQEHTSIRQQQKTSEEWMELRGEEEVAEK